MKKGLMIGCFLILTAVVVFFMLRHSDTPTQQSAVKTIAKGTGTAGNKAVSRSTGVHGKDVRASAVTVVSPVDLISADAEDAESEGPFPTVAIDVNKPVVMVNGRPVSLGDTIAPGVLRAGDLLPESTYQKFLDQAVDQALLVEKAEELGLSDTEEMAAIKDSMKRDMEEMGLVSTEEEKEWELNHFTKMAVINELYHKEGLISEKVGRDEVKSYYEEHGDEYEWLRKREAARGRTPEKIERSIQRQIKRDLEAPRKKDIREKRKAYTQTLREQADIEMVK